MVAWEPLGILQDASSANLVDENQSAAEPRTTHKNASRRQGFLRIFKLRILGRLVARKLRGERRKVAMHKSRRMAMLHCLLHLIPLAGAMALLALNLKPYFIGPYFSDSTPLQFAAKFHELLMQATIIEIILCVIRTQIVRGYIPLGALSASTQALQLSYLWSSDFVSAISSRAFQRWRKAVFVISAPLLIFLTALLGPSSAVLMIPRAGCSHRLRPEMMYTNVSFETLFPSCVDKTDGLHVDLDRFNLFESSLFQYKHTEPKHITFVNTDSDVYQRVTSCSTVRSRDYSHASSISTMPMQFSAQLLFYLFTALQPPSNVTLSVIMPQPVTVARCNYMESPYNNVTEVPYIQDDGFTTGALSNFSALIRKINALDRNQDVQGIYFPPLWSTSPESRSNSTVGSFLTIDSTCNGWNISLPFPLITILADEYEVFRNECLSLVTCTVSAFWDTSRVEMTYSDGTPLARIDAFPVAEFSKPKYTSPIAMNLNGIASLQSSNLTSLVGTFPGSNVIDPPETGVAAMFVTALSEISGPAMTTGSYVETEDPTGFEITAIQYGYGYATSPASVCLSIAIIVTYCVITLGYMIYILISGTTSTAWDSAMELVLLALQSKTPDHLGHVSAGIDSLETYREAVGIRVNDQDNLELVFAHDRDIGERNLRRVVPNKAY